MNPWESRFQERRGLFIVKASERLVAMSRLLEQLKTSRSRQAVLELNRQFHQFVGAGGIYELTEFCRLAIASEDICSVVLAASDGSEVLDLGLYQLAELSTNVAAMQANIGAEMDLLLGQSGASCSGAVLVAELSCGNNGQARILCLDDDPDHSRFTKDVLEAAGYLVSCVDNCEKYKTALPEFAPHLVLLDQRLAACHDGGDMWAFMQQNAGFADIQVLTLLHRDGPEMPRITGQSGPAKHLIKPVGKESLLEMVAQELSRRVYNA